MDTGLKDYKVTHKVKSVEVVYLFFLDRGRCQCWKPARG